MNSKHHIRNVLAGEKITFAEMNIQPQTSIQRMSHRELEAELSFHIGHAKSIHIAPAVGRHGRSENPEISSATPRYQSGYRSRPLDTTQASWGT